MTEGRWFWAVVAHLCARFAGGCALIIVLYLFMSAASSCGLIDLLRSLIDLLRGLIALQQFEAFPSYRSMKED